VPGSRRWYLPLASSVQPLTLSASEIGRICSSMRRFSSSDRTGNAISSRRMKLRHLRDAERELQTMPARMIEEAHDVDVSGKERLRPQQLERARCVTSALAG
jgi:hypothetical protein